MVRAKNPVMGYAAQEAEWLMATYGFSLDDALWRHPRAATLVLMPASRERLGATGLMSYTDMASARARNEVMRWIQTCFTIVDESPAVVGWRLGEAPAFLTLPSEPEQPATEHAVSSEPATHNHHEQ